MSGKFSDINLLLLTNKIFRSTNSIRICPYVNTNGITNACFCVCVRANFSVIHSNRIHFNLLFKPFCKNYTRFIILIQKNIFINWFRSFDAPNIFSYLHSTIQGAPILCRSIFVFFLIRFPHTQNAHTHVITSTNPPLSCIYFSLFISISMYHAMYTPTELFTKTNWWKINENQLCHWWSIFFSSQWNMLKLRRVESESEREKVENLITKSVYIKCIRTIEKKIKLFYGLTE